MSCHLTLLLYVGPQCSKEQVIKCACKGGQQKPKLGQKYILVTKATVTSITS